jgi:hypothetical protein
MGLDRAREQIRRQFALFEHESRAVLVAADPLRVGRTVTPKSAWPSCDET